MKSLIHSTVVVSGLMAASAAMADTTEDTVGKEGRQIAITLFETIDERRDAGNLNAQDIVEFGEAVTVSMDADGNGLISRAEFLEWDPGFSHVAEKVGRIDGFVTAQKIMFAMWDADGDDQLTTTEMKTAMSRDFRRADTDDSGTVNQDEFIAGFPIIVAMRAAIRPDL